MNAASVQARDSGLLTAALAQQLPDAITTPIQDRAALLGRVLRGRRRWVNRVCDEHVVYHHVRTGTWVDIGGWLGPRKVDAFATGKGIVLLAAGYDFEGDRPVYQFTPFAELTDSLYNHITGQLLLAPAPGVSVTALKMHPIQAYQLLAQIHRGPQNASDANEQSMRNPTS